MLSGIQLQEIKRMLLQLSLGFLPMYKLKYISIQKLEVNPRKSENHLPMCFGKIRKLYL